MSIYQENIERDALERHSAERCDKMDRPCVQTLDHTSKVLSMLMRSFNNLKTDLKTNKNNRNR